MINNPRIYEDVTNGVKNMLACTNTLDIHNAIFGTNYLNHGVLKGAIMDSSIAICISFCT